MKQHLKHIAGGGIVAPATLGLVVTLANWIQRVLGMNLHGSGLAIYVAAFLLGSAAIVHGQLRLEAQRLLSELGSGGLDLGKLLGSLGSLPDLFGDAGAEASTSPGPPPPAPPTLPAP